MHIQDSRNGSGDYPQTSYESRQEDRKRASSLDESFTALNAIARDMKEIFISL
jgi:hypothetical protein